MVVRIPLSRDERVRTPCMIRPPDTMFPPVGETDKWAKPRQVCRSCPIKLKTKCLMWALRLPEEHGMWGGTTPTERRAIRARKGWP